MSDYDVSFTEGPGAVAAYDQQKAETIGFLNENDTSFALIQIAGDDVRIIVSIVAGTEEEKSSDMQSVSEGALHLALHLPEIVSWEEEDRR